jgi:hypothetical protein
MLLVTFGSLFFDGMVKSSNIIEQKNPSTSDENIFWFKTKIKYRVIHFIVRSKSKIQAKDFIYCKWNLPSVSRRIGQLQALNCQFV